MHGCTLRSREARALSHFYLPAFSVFEPIDQLFDQRVDAGAPGVEPEVRVLVGCAAEMEQALERRAIGGQRAPTVGRQTRDHAIEGNIEPHRDAIAVHRGAVLRIDERAAACRHDKVPRAYLLQQYRALGGAEV